MKPVASTQRQCRWPFNQVLDNVDCRGPRQHPHVLPFELETFSKIVCQHSAQSWSWYSRGVEKGLPAHVGTSGVLQPLHVLHVRVLSGPRLFFACG